MRPSMGSVGDAYDNAMCESFFSTLEAELLSRYRFQSQAEARMLRGSDPSPRRCATVRHRRVRHQWSVPRFYGRVRHNLAVTGPILLGLALIGQRLRETVALRKAA